MKQRYEIQYHITDHFLWFSSGMRFATVKAAENGIKKLVEKSYLVKNKNDFRVV